MSICGTILKFICSIIFLKWRDDLVYFRDFFDRPLTQIGETDIPE
jgi:hypothetical protein